MTKPTTTPTRLPGKRPANPRALRLQTGLNQSAFWGAIGVTQSGGSRYESGRAIPGAVAELMRLRHGENIDPCQLCGEQAEVVRLMQAGTLRPAALIKQSKRLAQPDNPPAA